MLKIMLVILFILDSCATSQPTPVKSAWVNLKDKKPRFCRPWELSEKEFEVRSLFPVSDGTNLTGYVVDSKNRNGSASHGFLKTVDPMDLNFQNIQQLPLSSRQNIVATAVIDRVPIVITTLNVKGRSSLEARSLNDNRVIAKSNFVLEGEIREAEVSIRNETIWLTLRTGDYTSAFAKLSIKGNIGTFSKVNFQSESRGAQLIDSGGEPILIESKSLSGKAEFKITRIKSKELSPGENEEIQISGQESVESWAVVSNGTGFDIATVVGDSMVGQGKLIIAKVMAGSTPRILWKKELPLPDIHLSEPVWLSTGGTLTLMKWLEGESTLGLYAVSEAGVENQKDKDIFPSGSVVISSFRLNNSEIGAIVRRKKDDLWIHEVCKIANL